MKCVVYYSLKRVAARLRQRSNLDRIVAFRRTQHAYSSDTTKLEGTSKRWQANVLHVLNPLNSLSAIARSALAQVLQDAAFLHQMRLVALVAQPHQLQL